MEGLAGFIGQSRHIVQVKWDITTEQKNPLLVPAGEEIIYRIAQKREKTICNLLELFKQIPGGGRVTFMLERLTK